MGGGLFQFVISVAARAFSPNIIAGHTVSDDEILVSLLYLAQSAHEAVEVKINDESVFRWAENPAIRILKWPIYGRSGIFT